MKEKITDKKNEKKIWNLPRIVSLDLRKTESGDYHNQTEDYASGTIKTVS